MGYLFGDLLKIKFWEVFKFMSENFTSKDLTVLGDILTYEQAAAKKSKMYSQTLTDPALQSLAMGLYERHQKRYMTLLEFLNKQG